MKIITIRYSTERYPSLSGDGAPPISKPMDHCRVQQTGGGGVLFHLTAEAKRAVADADVVIHRHCDGSGSLEVGPNIRVEKKKHD